MRSVRNSDGVSTQFSLTSSKNNPVSVLWGDYRTEWKGLVRLPPAEQYRGLPIPTAYDFASLFVPHKNLLPTNISPRQGLSWLLHFQFPTRFLIPRVSYCSVLPKKYHKGVVTFTPPLNSLVSHANKPTGSPVAPLLRLVFGLGYSDRAVQWPYLYIRFDGCVHYANAAKLVGIRRKTEIGRHRFIAWFSHALYLARRLNLTICFAVQQSLE